MYPMAENGFQSVLTAPTQVLASQHYADLCRIVEPLGYPSLLCPANVYQMRGHSIS